jgi:hypothetical protein
MSFVSQTFTHAIYFTIAAARNTKDKTIHSFRINCSASIM